MSGYGILESRIDKGRRQPHEYHCAECGTNVERTETVCTECQTEINSGENQ